MLVGAGFVRGSAPVPPVGVRGSSTAFSLLKSKMAQSSGNIVLKGDSNNIYPGADNITYEFLLPMELERSLFGSNLFNNAKGPNGVVVVPFMPDTATSNIPNAPQFEATQFRTYGGLRVIGPANPENSLGGSPFNGWIQPATPGVDNATAGVGYCMEIRINIRAGDASARWWTRNARKVAICYDLGRATTVAVAAGTQPGYDDSNASVNQNYATSYNRSTTFNVVGETTGNTSYGADPAGIYFNGGNVSCSYTGGSDYVGPVWTEWFTGAVNPGNRDCVIRIRIPTGSAIRMYGIAIAGDNANGNDRSHTAASSPSWCMWNLTRSGQAARHYSPVSDPNGSVTAEQIYRRFFGSVENLFGVPKVSGAALSGASGVPTLGAPGVDVLVCANMVNEYTGMAQTPAQIKAANKNIADQCALLNIPMVKIMPPCPSLGEANATNKNNWAVNYALVQAAMRELVNECPNFILVDTWEALGNPVPTDQFTLLKLHSGYVINNQPPYSFDGQHFTAAWRNLAVFLATEAFRYAKG